MDGGVGHAARDNVKRLEVLPAGSRALEGPQNFSFTYNEEAIVKPSFEEDKNRILRMKTIEWQM